MRRKNRWVMFLLSLAVVLTIAHDRAQSQAPAPASAAPLQIKQVAYLKASNPHDSDHFGCGGNLPGHSGNAMAISADGNILAVGAHQESSAAKGVNGNQNDTSLHSSGAVYVFARRGNTWVPQAYVKASNPLIGANFGMNVALNSDATTMAVSAYWESSSSKGVNSTPDDKVPQAGAVYLDGQDLYSLSIVQRARCMAVVPQARRLPTGYTVWQTVLLGRTPYLGWLGRPGPQDRERTLWALERTGTLSFAGQRVEELSGGEQQLVLLARALAQIRDKA